MVQNIFATGAQNRAFQINGVKGVKISDSHFNGCLSEPLVGYTEKCQDVQFERVDFQAIATASQGGVTICNADRVERS